MDKIEKICQEIGRLKGLIDDSNYYLDNSEQAVGYESALDDLNEFIGNLSEEPDKNLDEAAEEWTKSVYGNPGKSAVSISGMYGFKAGAKWKKEQMLKDAVDGYVNYYEDSGGKLMAEAQVGCPYHIGDKVRIIIVKEEENK